MYGDDSLAVNMFVGLVRRNVALLRENSGRRTIDVRWRMPDLVVDSDFIRVTSDDSPSIFPCQLNGSYSRRHPVTQCFFDDTLA